MNGLEALKRIRQETCPATYMSDFDKNECCDIIEKELKDYERRLALAKEYKDVDKVAKRLKALEIIKKYISVDEDENGLYWLNLIGCASIGITREEYELLKEVIKND